jgi:hypothetical protein
MECASTMELKELARSILNYENPAGKFAGNDSALARVCEKLGRTLGKSTGVQGFQSLLKRSLALSNEEFPGLVSMQTNADGSLDVLEKLKLNSNTQAEIVVLAQLLGLLVTFFGAELTRRLLLETWPASNVDLELENPRFHSGASQLIFPENPARADGANRSSAFSTKSIAKTPPAPASRTVIA